MATTIRVPTESQLEKMTVIFEALRVAPQTIARYSSVFHIPDGWIELTEDLQKETIEEHSKEFGLTTKMEKDIALNVWRIAHTLYPNNQIFNNAIHVKNNYANEGKFSKGDKVPNMQLCNRDGSPIYFHDILSPNHMNAVFTGSHSWQPFRANARLINELGTWFPSLKRTFVYISEAHASDVWPIGMSAGVDIKKHQTITDRALAAANFVKEYDFTASTYLDNMDDTLRDMLAAWPFRFYLIRFDQTKQVYVFDHIAMPNDADFDMSILLDLLQ